MTEKSNTPVIFHGIPKNADKVTEQCVVKTVVEDMKVQISVDDIKIFHIG